MADGKKDLRNKEVPVIGISRHRLGIDGDGVTTLVAFYGCNLRCRYCLNPECFDRSSNRRMYSPQSLLDELMKDDVYFRATGGGVTFGGGEPGLQTEFICEFKKICPPQWKIRLETALQFHYQYTELLASIIDEWIVDVKTAGKVIYQQYTGGDYQQVVKNLHYLVDEFRVPKEKFVIRVPIIPGFTDRNQAEETERQFREQGFTRFDIFEYQTERPDHYRSNGKAKCELLKTLRNEIADSNGIEYESRECSHQGDCSGTCPLCEFELAKLSSDLQSKEVESVEVSNETIERINNLKADSTDAGEDSGDIYPLQGDMIVHPGKIEPPLEGEIALPSEPPYKKVLFKECAVAGVSFHLKYDDEIWDELEAGQEVALVRERKNKYDKNAVAIALKDDYDGDSDNFDFDFILGYVPKSENEEIAKMLDMGWEDVFYTTLSTVKTHGNINDRLRISIFIRDKKPDVVKPDTLRIQSLGYNESLNVVKELEVRGIVHFRWGGYPTWERNLPEVGDEVVLLRRQANQVMMLLTRIIAKDEDCVPFVGEDEVFAVDDCVCFILSNVCGPIFVDIEQLDFLGKDSLGNREVYDNLPKEDSDTLKDIFHKRLYTLYKNNIDLDPSLDDPKEGIPEIIEWITKPTLNFYYRDTSAPLYNEYHVGEILRTDFTIDLSEKFFKPTKKTRFLLASAHVNSHCEMYKPSKPNPQELDWRLVTIPRNSYFMVLDVYMPEDEDKRQILLLHIPAEALEYKDNIHFELAIDGIKAPYPYCGELVDAARKDFDAKLKSTVFPRQRDKELIERMKRPIGFIKKGEPVSLTPPIDERQLVRGFISEKLNGNIEELADFDFSTLADDKKYGCIAGPNIVCNYAIVKALFSIAFGDKWPDLCMETLDDYTYQISPIVLTQRLFGSLVSDKYFIGLDKHKDVVTPDLMHEVFAVERLCRTIGNMLVWPNKACLYRIYDDWQMRGYFDRMLQAMYSSMTGIGKENDSVRLALQGNHQLMHDYQGKEGFENYINNSLLNDFVDKDFTPKETFVGVSIAAKDFWPSQLPLAIHEMYVFCKHFIPNRTQKIISILRERL